MAKDNDGKRSPKKETAQPADAIPSLVEAFLTAPVVRREGPINLHEDRYSKSTNEVREMEDSIFHRGLEVLDAVSMFGQVDPATAEPSREMLDRYGDNPEKLATVNRIARYALKSAKEAPVGIKVMTAFVVGLARARAQENMAPREMKVAILNVGGGVELPEQELEE